MNSRLFILFILLSCQKKVFGLLACRSWRIRVRRVVRRGWPLAGAAKG